MESLLGFDTEDALPPEAVIAAGGHWVGGYVSDEPSKNMTEDAYRAYRAAGLGVVLFAENNTTDWQMSAAEAQGFGIRCRRQANGLGHEIDRPIFASIDTELVDQSQLVQGTLYLLEFAKGASSPPAGYGQNNLGRFGFDHGLKFFCNSAAWDDGVASKAQITQCRRAVGQPMEGFNVNLPGTNFTVDYDWTHADDFGQAPAPGLQPPVTIPGGSDMFLFRNPGGPEQYLCCGAGVIHLFEPDYRAFLEAHVVEVPVSEALFKMLTRDAT